MVLNCQALLRWFTHLELEDFEVRHIGLQVWEAVVVIVL
jgi:hypothetical protein